MGAPKGTRPPSAGKGRKKGTPNKVTSTLKEMVLQALRDSGGVEFLVRQAKKKNNAPFLALLAKVMPTQVDANVEHRYVALMPEVSRTTEEWKQQYAPKTLQ